MLLKEHHGQKNEGAIKINVYDGVRHVVCAESIQGYDRPPMCGRVISVPNGVTINDSMTCGGDHRPGY